MHPYRRLADRLRAIWRSSEERPLEPEYVPIADQELLDSLQAELAKVRKEAACRQRIGNVIARYFIKRERTPDIAIPFDAVTIDSDPVWVPGMLERSTLTEPEFAVFRFFDSPEQVPTHCVTQGLGTIMDARRLVLVAQGEGKADAIAAAVEGPVSSVCPASILQFHEHATVIVDEAAASKLRLAEYYKYTYDNKPAWQL